LFACSWIESGYGPSSGHVADPMVAGQGIGQCSGSWERLY
jgi:hypothetical protein